MLNREQISRGVANNTRLNLRHTGKLVNRTILIGTDPLSGTFFETVYS